MKKYLILFSIVFFTVSLSYAQRIKNSNVPAAVKIALQKKCSSAKNVVWEKENGNYEANWGGKSNEDNSVQFSPSGAFIEYVKAIPVSQLPKAVGEYVRTHYKAAKITEAGKVTDAKGKTSYEAEVNKKDMLFDENGNFIKAD
jgi:hypothetical protein